MEDDDGCGLGWSLDACSQQQQQMADGVCSLHLGLYGHTYSVVDDSDGASSSSGLNQSVPGAQAAQGVRYSGSDATDTCVVPSL